MKKDRTGQTGVNRQGLKMTITAYRSYDDIDVKFEDGNVRRHVSCAAFRSGSLPSRPRRHPQAGEAGVNRQGLKMRVAAARSKDDVDVVFEDGAVRRHVRMAKFRQGLVPHPDAPRGRSLAEERVGERRKNSRGRTMEVAAYRKYGDIDVRFDDGSLREHVSYRSFRTGSLLAPGERPIRPSSAGRLGERGVNRDGLGMEVAAYRSSQDIDVRFDDGSVREHVPYAAFRKGGLLPPSAAGRKGSRRPPLASRVGEAAVNSKGEKMTIVAYRNARDIDIAFEDGSVKRHAQYSAFKSGRVAREGTRRKRSWDEYQKRVGERRANTKGQVMEIVRYGSSSDVDVRFEDGRVKEGVTYSNFKSGKVAPPPGSG